MEKSAPIYTFGPKGNEARFQLDSASLKRDGTVVPHFGPKLLAFQVLTILVEAREKSGNSCEALDRKALFEKFYRGADGNSGEENFARTHIKLARKALGSAEAIRHDRTSGYWFNWDVTKCEGSSETTTSTSVEQPVSATPGRSLPELEAYRKILIDHLGRLKLFTLKPDAVIPAEAVFVRDVYIAPRVKEGGPYAAETQWFEAGYENTEAHPPSSLRSFEEFAASHKRLVIVGGSGLGKSLLLDKIALDWAQGFSDAIPFLIDLQKFDVERSRPRNFAEYLEIGTTLRFNLPGGTAEELLRERQTVVMFDGLDRLHSEQARGAMVDAIINFAEGHASSRIIMTTRAEGYATAPGLLENLKSAEFHNVTLQEFDAKQIEEYSRRWYAATHPDTRSKQEELVRWLQSALNDSASLRALAGNPLLLTLMLLLSPGRRLPLDRLGIYSACGEVLAKHWNVSAHDASVRTDDKMALLQGAAIEMRDPADGPTAMLISEERLRSVFADALAARDVPGPRRLARAIVSDLGDQHSLIRRVGPERYSFVHQTFLDFFAAREFSARLREAKEEAAVLNRLRNRCGDEAWHDLLRFVCGMIAPELALKAIREFLAARTKENPWPPVFIAADCLCALPAPMLAESERTETLAALRELTRFDFPYHYVLGPEGEIVGRVRQGAVKRLARGWREDSTRRWLMQIAGPPMDGAVRDAAVTELARGWHDDDSTREWLFGLSGTPELVAAAREMARGWPDDRTREWLEILLRRADDASVRAAALHELACQLRQDSTRPWLVEIVRNCADAIVRREALHELARGWQDESTRELLFECACDADVNIRSTAVWELGEQTWRSEETRQLLLARADDPQISVRRWAIRALARVWRNKDTLAWLRSRATAHNDVHERAEALRQIAGAEVWRDDDGVGDFLADRAVSDTGGYARAEALTQLAQFWPSRSTRKRLDDGLQEKDPQIRRAAVRGLARTWQDGRTVDLLAKACADEEASVRRAAVEELARGWRTDVVQDLLLERAAADESNDVRYASVMGLGRGWRNERTKELLLHLVVNEKGQFVRLAAEVTLGRAWPDDPEVRSVLDHLRRQRESGSAEG